jgi:hypothetical protein
VFICEALEEEHHFLGRRNTACAKHVLLIALIPRLLLYGVVLFGKELGLIFLVPALALREASVLFFLSRLRVLLIPSPHKAKLLDFPPF